MSNTPKNASERTFQENFVGELRKYRWEGRRRLRVIFFFFQAEDGIRDF